MLNPDAALGDYSIKDLHLKLRKEGCNGCRLGSQEGLRGPVLNNCVKYPGALLSCWAIIGEGPGQVEDKLGIPFVGPAGKLLDKMLEYLNLPEPHNMPLISNICKCRPIAAPCSGKQNDTPTKDLIEACRPYIMYELSMIKPKLVVLAGRTAYEGLLGEKIKSFKEVTGKLRQHPEFPGMIFTAIYHPAFLLRKKNMREDQYKPFRDVTIATLDMVRGIIVDEILV